MTEQQAKRSWVWKSDAQSVKDRTVSVWAVTETLVASGLGLWVWFHWGLYPLLLSSLVAAFLTMLRSDASVKLGSEWFQTYWNHGYEAHFQGLTLFTFLGLMTVILTAGTYWIATSSLALHSGWPLFWRSAAALLFSVNAAFAFLMAYGIGSNFDQKTVISLFATFAAGIITMAVAVPEPWATLAAGATVAILYILLFILENGRVGARSAVVFGCGVASGIFLRALIIRAIATLRHIRLGIYQFPENWAKLMTSIDAWTEPEIVPNLPSDSDMRIRNVISRFKFGALKDRAVTTILALFCFLPTWLFRITLKSTFPIYWPLLYISSAPKARKTDDGSLTWNSTTGKSLIDHGSFVIALAVVAAIGSTIYDPSFIAQYVQWADPRGLPSHAILQAFSFKVWELDIWEWFALTASAITVITYLWGNVINLRHSGETSPGWGTLKLFYALTRLKTICVIATILTAFFGILWFVHDTCTLFDWMTRALTYALGAPGACVPG